MIISSTATNWCGQLRLARISRSVLILLLSFIQPLATKFPTNFIRTFNFVSKILFFPPKYSAELIHFHWTMKLVCVLFSFSHSQHICRSVCPSVCSFFSIWFHGLHMSHPHSNWVEMDGCAMRCMYVYKGMSLASFVGIRNYLFLWVRIYHKTTT